MSLCLSTRKLNICILATAGFVLWAQALLAGPPAIPHFGGNYTGNNNQSVQAAPRAAPFVDRTKDKTAFVHTEARSMGLTRDAISQRLVSNSTYKGVATQSELSHQNLRKGNQGKQGGYDNVHDLNVIMNPPTYIRSGTQKAR